MASQRHIPTIIDNAEGVERNRLVRKHLTRQEFGKRLYTAMLEKGWTQAELSRRSGVLRDSVSNYVRGNILPEPANLKKLADALGVNADDLLPNYTEQAIETASTPALEIISSQDNPDESILRINRVVKSSAIPGILKALEEGK